MREQDKDPRTHRGMLRFQVVYVLHGCPNTVAKLYLIRWKSRGTTKKQFGARILLLLDFVVWFGVLFFQELPWISFWGKTNLFPSICPSAPDW